MEKIISYCKQNELSIQAYFSAAYLKASLELFKNNLEEADVVNFQIIFEQRKYSTENKKCIMYRIIPRIYSSILFIKFN